VTALVLAEHDNVTLTPGTLSAITAARQAHADVHVLIAGYGAQAAADDAAAIEGVTRVVLADADHLAHGTAENIAATLVGALEPGTYSHVVAAATTYGQSVLPRVAALLDVEHISGVIAVESADTFVRPIYAGALLATVQSGDPVKVITVRATAFPQATTAGVPAPIDRIAPSPNLGLSRVETSQHTTSDRPDLASARVVVAGGRALGSAENFGMLEALASRLDGAVGATRAAVDAGYVGNHLQVGQSGKIVSPDLYIAVGVSGAVQHLAGMKDSKVIVAINKDADAPIFQVADYGIVGDLFEVIPALLTALE
jgi:electron transfer flavoprotein alpha subunit